MEERTRKKLEEAFRDEAMAYLKYMAWAKKAEGEPLPDLAKVLRAAAEGEKVHAFLVLSQLGLGEMADNLERAISGETKENEMSYVNMVNDAKEEGDEGAAQIFEWIRQVEGQHKNYLEEMRAGRTPFEKNDIYVCQGCGHIAIATPPDVCPVCGAPMESFSLVK